ncbi:MAG TPA: hypothetical protein VL727_29055 [Puia sp.]|jgi:hypothetical protein|nr:hypothetical protein [Puia sp.]
MSQTLLEKLQLQDEKNLLIQGLPSSIEKQFTKLAFAKNLTPLLKSRKIDFALIFAINEQQLGNIVREVLPALQPDAKFWLAYPKVGSKIATTLNREGSWGCITCAGYESEAQTTLDHCWTAVRFKKTEAVAVAAKKAVVESTVSRKVSANVPGKVATKVTGKVATDVVSKPASIVSLGTTATRVRRRSVPANS